MNNLLVIAIALMIWLLTFAAGVIAAAAVKSLYAAGAAAVVVRVKSLYAAVSAGAAAVNEYAMSYLLVQQVKAFGVRATFGAYVEVLFCLVIPAAAAAVTSKLSAGAAAVKSSYATVLNLLSAGAAAVLELLTYELADTTRSIYDLNITADSTAYAAGEYLIRDNGMWRNVYLTQHARSLMGDSADVIALSAATVTDSRGTANVWTIAIA